METLVDKVVPIIVFLAILIGILTILNSIIRHRKPKLTNFPYRKKSQLLNHTETSLYQQLTNLVGEKFVVFSKVRLADLVLLQRDVQDRQVYIDSINSDSVDFLLCDRETTSPELAISCEDYPSKKNQLGQGNSNLVAVLKASGISFLRLQANRSYEPKELRSLIRSEIGPLKKEIEL